MKITSCHQDDDGACTTHGGVFDRFTASCQTTSVLLEVREERAQQFARYGLNDDLEYGTGPQAAWLAPVTNLGAADIERLFRSEYYTHDKPTWAHLIREELAEAFKEDDPARLREELVQVAALAVSCIEKLDAEFAIDPDEIDDFSGVPC